MASRSAQAVVVACARHGGAHDILVFIDALQHGCQEQQELVIVVHIVARVEEVFALHRGNGPVVVFAAAVDALEGLFMEQADHAVFHGDALHVFHHELVVVRRDVDRREDRSQLVLGRRYLVMLGLGQDAQLPQFFVQLFHEGFHTRFDDAEVVVFHFLSLRHLRAEQGAAAVDQVAAFLPQLLVDQEVFLFRPDVRDDLFGMDAEQGQHAFG